MMFSSAALVLVTLAVESASAISLGHAHRHIHAKKSDLNAVVGEQLKRDAWTPPKGYVPSDMSWTTNAALMAFTKTMALDSKATPGVVVGSKAEVDTPAVTSPAAAAAVAKASPSPAAKAASSGSSLLQTDTDAMSDVKSLISSASLSLSNGVCMAGVNSQDNKEKVWLGTGGAYDMTMSNTASHDITLVLWESDSYTAMFVQKYQPLITVKIPSGKCVSVAMVDGVSGAFTAIYPDTTFTVNGNIHNTLGEFTTQGGSTTFDTSYETANSGHSLSIDTGSCTSARGQCGFECTSFSAGGDWCEGNGSGSYTLVKGDQSSCNVGTYAGNASGGCPVTGNKITATWS